MKKNYTIKKTEKLLRELRACRDTLDYLTSLREAPLTPRKKEILQNRIRRISDTLGEFEHKLGILDPVEQKILRGLYLDGDGSVEEVCRACALEKSSVYRYRARAIEKLAAAMYGE